MIPGLLLTGAVLIILIMLHWPQKPACPNCGFKKSQRIDHQVTGVKEYHGIEGEGGARKLMKFIQERHYCPECQHTWLTTHKEP